MAKHRKPKVAKANLTELLQSRNGGQVALQGYSYQFLYSCFLILSNNEKDTVFTLEGIEDIDTIKCCNDSKNITHIQLKFSTVKQDASFMDGVLKNYIEAYLINKDREFKLVYDFSVAKGNLSKLFSGTLDDVSKKFWKEKIEKIKKETLFWCWNNFDFEDFISKLSFENIKRDTLERCIEDALIKNFDISTDNIVLYANGIKLLCFDKMQNREEVTYDDVLNCINIIRFDISKGPLNPAHSWIQRIKFEKDDKYSSGYYEGKKATPADIANNLPIARPTVEKEVAESIEKNTVTVIKTSSGQGKTTLAYRTILALQEEYTPYQLSWCNNVSEIERIVEYFRMRTRIGERPLILLDNLDAHLSEWNMLAQFMQTNVTYHYKILVTTRENDWYNYGGDISNIHSLKIIKPVLSEKEAESIFNSFKAANKLHPEITDWKTSWSKISDRQLLIEYVYLLTHGEMIAERISAQMKEIGNASAGGVKFEVLRKVCLADICGIKLETNALINSLTTNTEADMGEVLKSMSEEFLVHISTDGDYIEGLHPVRSQHIVKRLHEFKSLYETALSIAKIADDSDISVLFSHYPEFDFDKESFYANIVTTWWDLTNLSRFVKAIRGTFSGSVLQYFQNNKNAFDDAHRHGGLTLVAIDLCPFTKFEGYDEDIDSLDKIAEMHPENDNIQCLIGIRNSIPTFKTTKTDLYYLNYALFQKLKNVVFKDIVDVESYAVIVDWLYNMNSSMNLAPCVNLCDLWKSVEKYSIETVSSLMYSSFCGNVDVYNEFVEDNMKKILNYLKYNTFSHTINVSEENKSISVGYILKASEITHGNNESVSRLTNICRTLPVFDWYCADAIKPAIDILDVYKIPDDAHKQMPAKNLIITFHKEFNGLWLKTIESNYEFDTVQSWLEHWLNVRQYVCDILNASCTCMHKLLQNQKLGNSTTIFDNAHNKYNRALVAPLSYPREHRPFEKELKTPQLFNKAKHGYFDSIQNFANQLAGFLKHDKNFEHLAIYNLKTALANLTNVQKFFDDMEMDNEHQTRHSALCINEERMLLETYMCCEYYKSHTPNLRFNKYQVKKWFNECRKEEIEKLNESLIELETSYGAVYPNQAYCENTFLCYPILLRNFDMSDENQMNQFLISTIEFATSSYDYLILLITDKDGTIVPTGLKFPKRVFEWLYNAVVLEKEEQLDELATPYPTDISPGILECFGGDFVLQKQNTDKNILSLVADVGEELWVYFKNRELLNEENDKQYLSNNLSVIKKRIEEMVGAIDSHVYGDLVLELNALCTDVYNGSSFDDKKFNELLSYIQNNG